MKLFFKILCMRVLRIKEWRKKLRLTQEELGKKVDFSERTIRNWEKEPEKMSKKNAAILLNIFQEEEMRQLSEEVINESKEVQNFDFYKKEVIYLKKILKLVEESNEVLKIENEKLKEEIKQLKS